MKKFSISKTFNKNGNLCTGYNIYRNILGVQFYQGHCSDIQDAKNYARQQGASKIIKDW
jgi:hypothetical protein